MLQMLVGTMTVLQAMLLMVQVRFGQAGVFNGSSSYINVDAINLPLNDFTISAWANTNNATPYGMILSTLKSGQGQMYFTFYQNKLVYADLYSSGSQTLSSPSGSIQNNIWYHCVITKSSTSGIKLYLDGSLVDSNASTTNLKTNSSGQNRIGGYFSPTPSDWFNGSIDQVRIFSRALRPYEVEALYTEEYCTPTIVPSEHFNTVTYTGNGSTQSITGVGFQPDFTWIKVRTNTDNHILQDSVRGVGKGLFSDLTNAENASMGGMTSFDSDGFTFDGSISSLNYSARDFVSWNFKAGGSAVTNTDGTITSQVSANTEAGFSIVSYTGNGANGTVGHGLGTTPNIVLTKRRNSTGNWSFNGNIGGLIYGTNKLALNDTAAIGADTNEVLAANSNNFTQGQVVLLSSGGTYVAYCFAEVEGFSNFGSYVGTGASGNTVVTGFEPAMIIVKRSSTFGGWTILDNKRNPQNPKNARLFIEESSAESVATSYNTDFIENGFVINGDGGGINSSGDTFIYMAFAADPTTIEPSLEDSFNTVVYSGNQVSGTGITGVGFQPDFVWIKDRGDGTHWHNLFDSVRGASERLFSNTTNAESFYNETLQSFDADGFTVGLEPDVNRSGTDNMVAWNWKGAELPAINSNGSIPSVVSANPAAGFSIVTMDASTSPRTVGHGLSTAPELIIWKSRTSNANYWQVLAQSANNGNGHLGRLALQRTDSFTVVTSVWNDTQPTDTVFTLGGSCPDKGVAYCFHSVAGFSKFGSYTGNGNAAGPTINCGFEPAFVMIKSTSDTGVWVMHDNKRGNYNNGDIYARLQAESSNAEVDDYPTEKRIDISSTGFTITNASNSWNGSGRTYIYMAFANQF